MYKVLFSIRKTFTLRLAWTRPHMSVSERIHFYSRLSLYLRSGIPIRDALGFMCDSARLPSSRKILSDVDGAILEGTSLTRALGAFPKVFPSFETHFVEVGERSGSLAENLRYAASLLNRKRVLTRKIRSALIYPLVIVLGTVAITCFLLFYTFPKIIPIFKGLDVPLPITTRMLIGVSDLTANHGLLLLGIACLVAVCIGVVLSRPKVRQCAEKAGLRSPLFGNLIRSYNLALFSRTLAILTKSGIPLIPALHLLGNGIRHQEYRAALKTISERVSEGRRLTQELKAYPALFPHTLLELIASGESTGSLGSSLSSASEFYEEELDEGIRTLTILIEPALMIVMGVLVGFIAMAIITPIYGITQNLSLH